MSLNSIKKKKEFLAVYWSQHLQVCEACKAVGISRNGFYKWMASDPQFSEAVKDLQEAMLDKCEGQLYKSIEAGDKDTIRYILEHKGKDRGWSEKKVELGGSVQLEIIRKVIDTHDQPTA